MALFDICGISSHSNFKNTENDDIEGNMVLPSKIPNPCQLALPVKCVSIPKLKLKH